MPKLSRWQRGDYRHLPYYGANLGRLWMTRDGVWSIYQGWISERGTPKRFVYLLVGSMGVMREFRTLAEAKAVINDV